LRLLIDTHFAVWLATDPGEVSAPEWRHLTADSTQIVLSAVSVWELRLKWSSLHRSGDRKGPVEPDAVVSFGQKMRWEYLSLTVVHATGTLLQPLLHRDPFDEMLLLQSQSESMPFLTRDRRLIDHPLAVSLSD